MSTRVRILTGAFLGLGLMGPPSAGAGTAWWMRLPPSPPSSGFHGLVVAHRGGSAAGPENTVVAIERAKADGATAVEVDVFLTADGVPVVIHDPTVDRTTDGTGRVADHTLAELRALNAAEGWPAYGHVPVPTLDEVLDAVERLDLKIEIELKHEVEDHEALARAIAETFGRRKLHDRAWVGSFDPTLVYRVRALDPQIIAAHAFKEGATGWTLVDLALASDWLPAFLGAGILEPRMDLVDHARLEAWRSAGYAINAWTANDGADQERLRALGVSYTTNCPLRSCEDDPTDHMQ